MDITKKIVITLSIDECNSVMKGLSKLTIEEAGYLYGNVDKQIKEQLKPQEEKTDGTEKDGQH